ncbi:hypothetical protein PV356_35260 [Streptomyces sp. WI03-5b]|uniref:hypothetical protein n=1 Tax=Streptomyces sp. WI03-5b TaxID=462946 RepID=UPI0029B5C727|nr:hypothetical protein [Streptomyces sp. WI03-5b]MDX2624680.1 hypothetical protein [Streptomyces sp. WI03-5b]
MGAQYRDSALSTYIKVAALAMRTDGCTAKVAVIAEYLGLSKSEVERALKQLARPDDVDGVTEVLTTRRTLPGGRGQSAHRTVRTADEAEHFVWIPVRAADALSPRLLRLYALIAYAAVRNVPLAVRDLGAMLYHHSGKSAGEHLGERQAARLLEELGATGWVTVHHREGLQGRHAYEAHRHPLQAVQLENIAPDIHDGSGADSHDGSLTSREDPRTDRPVTKTGVGGGIRRRRPAGSKPTPPVDNSVSTTFRSAGHGEKRSNTSAPGSGNVGGDLTRRSWQVLEPVHHLLPGLSSWVLRRIDAEIGRQLAHGTGTERLTARLTARYASTETPRDPGRWILGPGLVRRGCHHPGCESGVMWHTSQPCQVCLEDQAPADDTRAQQQRPVPEERPVRAVVTDWVPRPAPAAEPPLELTRAQLAELRAAATPEAVRQAITEHGRARATYLYGHALVLPHLATIDDPEGNPA